MVSFHIEAYKGQKSSPSTRPRQGERSRGGGEERYELYDKKVWIGFKKERIFTVNGYLPPPEKQPPHDKLKEETQNRTMKTERTIN